MTPVAWMFVEPGCEVGPVETVESIALAKCAGKCGELVPLYRTAPEGEFAQALELLRSLEFVTVLPSKCPVCLGWEPKGNGETSKHHNKTCALDAFLKRHQRGPQQESPK